MSQLVDQRHDRGIVFVHEDVRNAQQPTDMTNLRRGPDHQVRTVAEAMGNQAEILLEQSQRDRPLVVLTSVRKKVPVFESLLAQQVFEYVLLRRDQRKTMTVLLQLPDRVLEEIEMRRMVQIDQYVHALAVIAVSRAVDRS